MCCLGIVVHVLPIKVIAVSIREGPVMAALPDPKEQPTLSVVEAAAVLEVKPRTVYNAVEAGTCPAIRMGRIIRVPTARFIAAYGLGPASAA